MQLYRINIPIAKMLRPENVKSKWNDRKILDKAIPGYAKYIIIFLPELPFNINNKKIMVSTYLSVG